MHSPAHTEPHVLVLAWTSEAGRGRSRALADELGAPALFMPWAEHRGPRGRLLFRYLRSARSTVAAVRSLPTGSVVLCQLPPVFAPMVVIATARGRVQLVLDAHSGTWNDNRWEWSHRLLARVLRRTSLLIVTNLGLLDGHPVPEATPVAVAHDPLAPRGHAPGPVEWPRQVVFPASGASDEPLLAVTEAGRRLSAEGVSIVVTGSHSPQVAGPGIERPGWLSQAEYEGLIDTSAAVLALTTREHTMQRAAYEALERGVPIVASGTGVLREALAGAAVYVDPDADSIVDGIREAIRRRDELLTAGQEVSAGMRCQTRAVLDQVRAMVST